MKAHFRVYGEGEIDGRRTPRDSLQLARGGEDEDLMMEKVHLEKVHELFRVRQILLPAY